MTRFDRKHLGEAKSFFEEHGFVILKDVLDGAQLELISSGWDNLVAEASGRTELSVEQFVERFPQNRDLWMKSEAFETLLFESPQAEIASSLLGISGVRLFHDHAIAKPAGRSSTIPWHQDNAYWPVDRAGLSLWTADEAVSQNGGCLTVLDGSHRDGPAEPQDFLSPAKHEHDEDPRLLDLPVQKGDTVVLHGLTWHFSRPNVSNMDRLAYLSLWIPSTSRYEPEHAGWHPTSTFIDVEPGERIESEWLPLFGDVPAEDEGEGVEFPAPAERDGPTMFKAGDQIAEQIAWLIGRQPTSLSDLLNEPGPAAIADAAAGSGTIATPDRDALVKVLDRVALQEKVRQSSVARDVYLETVGRWWKLAGSKIREARADG